MYHFWENKLQRLPLASVFCSYFNKHHNILHLYILYIYAER